MSPTLRALLDRLGPADRLEIGQLSAALYDSRYTGPATFHWLNGRLQQVDVGEKGSPIRFTIVEGARSLRAAARA